MTATVVKQKLSFVEAVRELPEEFLKSSVESTFTEMIEDAKVILLVGNGPISPAGAAKVRESARTEGTVVVRFNTWAKIGGVKDSKVRKGFFL